MEPYGSHMACTYQLGDRNIRSGFSRFFSKIFFYKILLFFSVWPFRVWANQFPGAERSGAEDNPRVARKFFENLTSETRVGVCFEGLFLPKHGVCTVNLVYTLYAL